MKIEHIKYIKIITSDLKILARKNVIKILTANTTIPEIKFMNSLDLIRINGKINCIIAELIHMPNSAPLSLDPVAIMPNGMNRKGKPAVNKQNRTYRQIRSCNNISFITLYIMRLQVFSRLSTFETVLGKVVENDKKINIYSNINLI